MHCNRHGRLNCTDSVCESWYRSHNYSPPATSLGVDITTGDPVMNLGGIGIDLATGEIELNLGGGVDIPL
jgi:hypothetical protein